MFRFVVMIPFAFSCQAFAGFNIGPVHFADTRTPFPVPPLPPIPPLRVPTITEVQNVVLPPSLVNPHTIECKLVRADANEKQEQLKKQIGRESDALEKSKARLKEAQNQLFRVAAEEVELKKYQEFLFQFQAVASNITVSQVELKAALTQLQARKSDQQFIEIINTIKTSAKDESLKKLASMTADFLSKTDSEAQSILDNPASTESLYKIVQLVQNSQSFVASFIGSTQASRKSFENTVNLESSEIIALQNRIGADGASLSVQDERTACKF